MNPLFKTAAADILSCGGVSAVFKPQSGSEVDTNVVLDTEVDAVGDEVRVAEERVQITCLRLDTGVPAPGDVFSVRGTDYIVDGLPDDEAGDAYIVRVIAR